MKQEDKLRKTLREYYDTQEIPFDANEWAQASAYLSEARRKRKLRYASFVLAVLFSALFIALYNFPTFSKDDKIQTSILSNTKTESVLGTASLIQNDPRVLKSKTLINKHSNQIQKSNHIFSSKTSQQKNTLTSTETNSDKSSGKNPQIFESSISLSELNPLEQHSNAGSETGNPNSVATISNVKIKAEDTLQQETQKNVVEEISKENTAASPQALVNVTSNQHASQTNEISPAAIKVMPETLLTLPFITNKKEIPAVDSTKYSDSKEGALLSKEDHTLQTQIKDTATTKEIVVEGSLPDTLSKTSRAQEGIFYEVGAAWYYGWNGPAERDARGFSPVAGINYMNKLSDNCSFSFGLQYLYVPGLSNSSKTSRVSTYQYGEQSKVTVVTPSTLHYILAPLRFHYFLNRNNIFGAGINLAYLLTVDAKVTSYDESAGHTSNYETTKLSGYTEGFSWFDSQLGLFYTRRIGRSLGLQAEVFLGLTDVKQNEFFDLNYKERNSGLKLTLIYYAFRKK